MDLFTFLEDTNTLKVDPKPWMQGGDYTLARATNETLTGIIDDCIAGGLYALDRVELAIVMVAHAARVPK